MVRLPDTDLVLCLRRLFWSLHVETCLTDCELENMMCILKGQTTFDTGNITVNSRPGLPYADPSVTQYE